MSIDLIGTYCDSPCMGWLYCQFAMVHVLVVHCMYYKLLLWPMGWLYVLPWVGCMYCHGLVVCIVMVYVGWLYVLSWSLWVGYMYIDY